MQVRGLSGEKAAALVDRYSTPARYTPESHWVPLPFLCGVQLKQCFWRESLALCESLGRFCPSVSQEGRADRMEEGLYHQDQETTLGRTLLP